MFLSTESSCEGRGTIPSGAAQRFSFRGFKTSAEAIRSAVMLYGRFPLSLRNVEDLLHERGIDIYSETVRQWWIRFGLIVAATIRRKRTSRLRDPLPDQGGTVARGYFQRKPFEYPPRRCLIGLVELLEEVSQALIFYIRVMSGARKVARHRLL